MITLDNYEKARLIIDKMGNIKYRIKKLQKFLNSDYNPRLWVMEVKPYSGYSSSEEIEHYGLLPEFLQMLLDKNLEKYEELKKEFEEL